LDNRHYGAWEKLSPDGPKVMQKVTEEKNKQNIGFNAVYKK
jgi:hypothetical protein